MEAEPAVNQTKITEPSTDGSEKRALEGIHGGQNLSRLSNRARHCTGCRTSPNNGFSARSATGSTEPRRSDGIADTSNGPAIGFKCPAAVFPTPDARAQCTMHATASKAAARHGRQCATDGGGFMAGLDEPFNGRVDGSGINRGSTSAIKQRVEDRKGHDQCCSTGLCTAMPSCILMLHGIRLPTTHIPCLRVIPLTYLKSLAEQARTRGFAEQPRKTPRITKIVFSLPRCDCITMHATNQIIQPLQDNSSTSGSSINEPRFGADPPDPPKTATSATSQTNPIDQVTRDSDRKGSNDAMRKGKAPGYHKGEAARPILLVLVFQ